MSKFVLYQIGIVLFVILMMIIDKVFPGMIERLLPCIIGLPIVLGIAELLRK